MKMSRPQKNEATSPLPLDALIQANDLVRAIQNSFEHADETEHAVTGLHFKNYTIIVRKRVGFTWIVECKFRPGKENQIKGEIK
jgi:hypothetical protein